MTALPLPLLLASHHGRPGLEAGMRALHEGRSALDAVQAATEAMERRWAAQVELDALIVDGQTLRSGAVLALPRCPQPVRVARHVMERTPYALLAGRGAERAMQDVGLEPLAISPTPPTSYDSEGHTVCFLARDAAGRIAGATCGHTLPLTVVGAGLFANHRHGAAGCTGSGSLALQAGTARSVVLYLKMGLPLWNACREAIKDSYEVTRAHQEPLHLIALDAHGGHAGFSNERGSTYWVQRLDRDEPDARPRTFVDAQGRADVRPEAPQ